VGVIVNATPVVPGAAEGGIVRSHLPISLWGGVDPATGVIIDRRHDRCGASIAGTVFVFPSEKGSSTGSAVLLELIRSDHAPAAIVTERLAPIVALGAIVADELYGRSVPILVLPEGGADGLAEGARVRISHDGSIDVISTPRTSDAMW